MPEGTVVRVKRDGTLKIKDGTRDYTVAYEAGDLNITIPGPTVNVFLDRGRFGTTPSLRYGDDQPMNITFSAYLRDLTDATYATLAEFILQSGYVDSTWVSTLGSSAEVQTYTFEWTTEGSDHGETDRVVTCNHAVFSGSIAEGDPSSINLTVTSYDLYPTIT